MIGTKYTQSGSASPLPPYMQKHEVSTGIGVISNSSNETEDCNWLSGQEQASNKETGDSGDEFEENGEEEGKDRAKPEEINKEELLEPIPDSVISRSETSSPPQNSQFLPPSPTQNVQGWSPSPEMFWYTLTEN